MTMIPFNLTISAACLLLALLLCLLSVVQGGRIQTKLVAIEVMVNILMSSIALWALFCKQSVYIDVCLPIALIMFLSTVAYCQILQPQGRAR